MTHDKSSFEIQKAQKVATLYTNLHAAFGEEFKYERFLGWVNQYLRPSREFHGLNHMLGMAELNANLSGKEGPDSAGVYSMVAGFFHDEDYPSIAEMPTHMSKRFLDKYIEEKDGKKIVKALAPDDRIGQILHGVFGFSEGQPLSPFPFPGNPGGMNEFYCAVAAAGELAELGKDEKFITAIVTGIEATVPFRGPDRMEKLRERLEKTNSGLKMGLHNADMDEIMIGAVYTANRDVSGFLGGLDPMDQNAKATTQSVLKTIKGGDMLSPEEIPELRMKGFAPGKPSGDYTPRDFLNARIKRAGLYHLVLAGNAEKRTIPNLFFETKLSGGDIYPPNGWAEKANKLAYENNLPVRTAEYARLISAGLVNAFTEMAADDPKVIKVRDLLAPFTKIVPEPKLSDNVSPLRKLAFECLSGREKTDGHDIPRSPIAQLILTKLDEEQIEKLGKASRNLLLPGDLTPPQIEDLNKTHPGVYEEGASKSQLFLKLATEYLGQTVEEIRSDVARSASASDGMKALAAEIRALDLPRVKTP